MGLMHNNSSLVSQQQLPKAVKLCKEKTFSNSPNSVLWPSCASGHQVENLHTLRPPLASCILFREHANLLAYLETSHVTFVLLARRNLISEDNHRMGHLDAAKNVISALDEDPPSLPRD
jgi:hypothetical protein